MKQWGQAFMLYTQDNDERFPLMGYENAGPVALRIPKSSHWYNAVYAYSGGRATYACIGDRSTKNASPLPDGNGNNIPGLRMSYLANDILGGASYDTATTIVTYNPYNLARINSAADTILMTEGSRGFSLPYFAENMSCFIAGASETGVPCSTFYIPAVDRGYFPRHFDGANVLFTDFHAKWVQVATYNGNTKYSTLQAKLPWEKHVNPLQTYADDPNNASARKWN